MNVMDWIPATATTLVLAGLLWLMRSLIATRLAKSVQHEFDAKLEKLRAQFRKSEEVLKADLRSKETEISALRSGAMTALANRQIALDRRRLDAVDQLWSAVTALAPARVISHMMASIKFEAAAKMRREALRCCFTILMSHRKRSDKGEPQTRFKEWYQMVGGAVEWCADLLDHVRDVGDHQVPIRFADIIAVDEENTPEETALAHVVETLYDKLGKGSEHKRFTMRQVADLACETASDGRPTDDATRLREAIDTLGRRRMREATAHAIALRLRNRLKQNTLISIENGGQATARLMRDGPRRDHKHDAEYFVGVA